MPTYEYKCDACGHSFEKFQSMTAAPIKKCPKCGKRKVRRLIGMGAGLIFKGSGFYITDYRDSGYKDKAKADSASGGAEAKADSKSDSKSDSKPDQKADSKADTKAGASDAKSDSKSAGTEQKPASKTESKPTKNSRQR
jgi:putative FmdB family regulatory protein